MPKSLATTRDVSLFQLEHKATLLKERIYATIILLAVLITLDPSHSTPLHAMLVIGGTTLSIWAASIVATRMSRRIILKSTEIDPADIERRVSEHAPLLAAGMFPLFMAALAFAGLLKLSIAVNLSIAYCLLLMIGWSLLSARALRANKLQTLMLASLELVIGLAIVLLKIIVSH